MKYNKNSKGEVDDSIDQTNVNSSRNNIYENNPPNYESLSRNVNAYQNGGSNAYGNGGGYVNQNRGGNAYQNGGYKKDDQDDHEYTEVRFDGTPSTRL